jgi:hypothetical protein
VDIDSLRKVAIEIRAAIESTPVGNRPISMSQFPHGACGDASLIVGACLKDLGVSGFNYICGDRGSQIDGSWTTHAWLQSGTCVIDITADQFSDAPCGVIVKDPSPWHGTFEVDVPQSSDFRDWHGPGAQMLYGIYASVRKIINQN